MSIESFSTFMQEVASNTTIQEECRPALENAETLDQLVSVGQKHGYEFTAAEASECLSILYADDGELSDDQLSSIGGGFGRFATSWRNQIRPYFSHVRVSSKIRSRFSWSGRAGAGSELA